nr:DDE-type integrase/transposase/recombinase [Vibrio sinus]
MCLIDICNVKYLNNIVEQSHRWVKQKTRQALSGWKSVEGAIASLHGREMWTMLKRGQIDVEGESAVDRFYALTG